MNNKLKTKIIVNALALLLLGSTSYAATPKFSIIPVPAGSNKTPAKKGNVFNISYKVINNLNDAKTLRMKPIAGVTQLTRGADYCDTLFRLGSGKSCTLRLRIDTTKMAIGSRLHNGPEICIGSTDLSCSRPSPDNLLDIDVLSAPDAPLTASSYDVVTATSLILTGGQANRTVTIRNTGNVATSTLTYTKVGFPSTSNVTYGPNCNPIPANTSCTLTFVAGTQPNISGAASPSPAMLNISGLNTNKLAIDFTVLTYGNIYQGGYLYKVINTPPSKNISGSIAELSDLNNATKYSWKPLGPVLTVNNSVSITNGPANSASIIAAYGAGDYAAYACSQLRVDDAGTQCLPGQSCFSNWYLPAICEIDSGHTYSANCQAFPDSMMSNLFDNGIGNFNTTTSYWASTTYTAGGDAEGWQMTPPEAIPYGNYPGNYWYFPVRCARTIS